MVDRSSHSVAGRWDVPFYLVLYFFSGAAGLAFQVVWVRLYTRVLGSTMQAVAIVTALFMVGLAIGSRIGGAIADRASRPRRLYAVTEALAAVMAAVSFVAVGAAVERRLMHELATPGGAAGVGEFVVFVALPLIVPVVVTTLMGMTMPILVRALTDRRERLGRDAGRVYVANTAGAMVGAGVAGFVLIGAVGVQSTAAAAVVANGLVAAIAFLKAGLLRARREASCDTVGQDYQLPSGRPVCLEPPSERPAVSEETAAPKQRVPTGGPAPEPATDRPGSGVPGSGTPRRPGPAADAPQAVSPSSEFGIGRPLLVVLFVVSGFLSLGYEAFWTRSLVTILGNSTYAVTGMLLVTLLGLVIGGTVGSRVVDRLRRPLAVLGGLEAGIGGFSLLALPLLTQILYTDGVQAFFFAERAGWVGAMTLRFGSAAAVLLVPSVLNGATLPIMLKTLATSMRRRGTDIGTAYAADSAGNVLGALFPAFVLLPLVGVSRGLLVLGVANVALALVYLLPRRRRVLALPVGALLLVGAAGVPIAFQFPSDTYADGDPVLFYREGVEATTRVYRKQDSGAYHMSVDGVFIGGSADAARKELVLAHLPRFFAADAESVLTVGLGSGVLAFELAKNTANREITVVEIAPSVAAGAAVVPGWRGLLNSDPRVSLVIDDVMRHLSTTADEYDVVVSDGKSRPTSRGNGVFFSRDYYDAAKRVLAPGGVFFQWVSLNLAQDDLKTVLRTFASAFAHTSVWWLPDADLFLIGSDREIEPSTPVGDGGALARYGVADASAALELMIASDAGIAAIAGDGPISSLDRPTIEFYDPRAYAMPPHRLIGANLGLLAEFASDAPTGGEASGSRGFGGGEPLGIAGASEDAGVLLSLLAAAYRGDEPAAELDRRAGDLVDAGSAPIRSALSRYFAVRAAARLRDGRPEDAAEYASRAIEAAGENLSAAADAHYYRGLARLSLGRAADAETEIRKAIAGSPDTPAFRVALARLLAGSGRTDEAIAAYEATLSIMEDNVAALQSVGVYETAQGDRERGLRLLARAYALAPHEASVIDSYAWALFGEGRLADARRVVRRGGDYYRTRSDFADRRGAILDAE